MRVVQLSDTHFAAATGSTHGGMGFDTAHTAVAVHEHLRTGHPPDLVVLTGDVADTGHPEEYRQAAAYLEQLPAPVYALPGNHDAHLGIELGLPRPGITLARTLRAGAWLFVFADSNHDGRERRPHGGLADRPTRVHDANGRLGPAELAWLHEVLAATDAPNVFVWVHHPPFMPGVFAQPAYDAEMDELLVAHPHLRGVGAGHVHTDRVEVRHGRPVHVCPSFTVNIDLDQWQMLPPGYRTYDFADDGTVTSTAHLLDDPRWPRRPIPEAGVRYLRGELGWEALQARSPG